MKTIGVRELRQYASKYLRDVERGETYQVTDRGRPVALLRPIRNRSRLDELAAQGRLRRGNGKSLLDLKPMKRQKGMTPLTEILLKMREEERF